MSQKWHYYIRFFSKAKVTNMRSEEFFTYSCGAYTNFLQEERKMRRLFFSRRANSMHFTRRVEKMDFFLTSVGMEITAGGALIEKKVDT